MQTATDDSVTLVEILDVAGSFDEARQLVQTCVARLEREGVPGLSSMKFYEDAAAKELAAVITFSNSSEILAHTRMISGWPEFQRFATLLRLKDMRIHGRVSAEVRAWLDQFRSAAIFRDAARRLQPLTRALTSLVQRGPSESGADPRDTISAHRTS